LKNSARGLTGGDIRAHLLTLKSLI